MQIAKMKWFGYYIVIETGVEDGFLGGKGRPCRFVYIYIYTYIYIKCHYSANRHGERQLHFKRSKVVFYWDQPFQPVETVKVS